MFLRRAAWFLIATTLLALPEQSLAADPPASMRRWRWNIVVETDGRTTETLNYEISVRTDEAARAEAQPFLPFTVGRERLELVEGLTIKPDGRRLHVAPGAVRTQIPRGRPGVAQYTNQRQMVAVLPEVAGGDVFSLTWRRTILRPDFSGHFTFSRIFPASVPWEDAEVSISLPKGMALNTETHGPAHQISDENGRVVHHWHWNAPANDRLRALAPLDTAPRFFASTFLDWPAFSRAYAALFLPRTEVTPRIQALADEVAAGATDKRQEAERLVAWVSRRIRWVALWVGNGNIVPHSADSILANGYGDCKDQVALLIALLRARGIAAEPVLINLTQTFLLSGPPMVSAFNHAIIYLPEWGIYADTTAGGAPFGTLPAVLYNKPILRITEAGAEPGRMPALPPGLATVRNRTAMRFGPDGRLLGETSIEASGPYAIILRQIAARVSSRGSTVEVAERLRAAGLTGEGEIVPDPLDPIGPDYRLSSRFVIDPPPGALEGEAFRLPRGMDFLPRPGEGLLGPIGLRGLAADEPTPCYAGLQEEEISLVLPEGRRPARLPRPRRIENAAFTFESTWSFEDRTLRVMRRFESRFTTNLCEGPLRAAAARALEDLRGWDLNTVALQD
jgi:hypothetical protein